MRKKWILKSKTEPENEKEIVEILLKNRDLISKKQIKEFLNPQNPLTINNQQLAINNSQLSKAIKRIKKAIKSGEQIIIYGDYDTDGICATAVLWEILYFLGAKVFPFIPHRETHGYGLKKKTIDEILNSETMKQWNNGTVKLIITVDNGIVAHKAINYAKEKGVDVIVTDHHQIKLKAKSSKLKAKNYDLPPAYAIIHTEKLAGAGVAWFFAREILKKFKKLKAFQQKIDQDLGLELAAIGTIADIMPLFEVNRSIVKYGLGALNKTNRIGLKALITQAGLKLGKIGTWEVGFIIAPRINAMGRLQHALDSLRLLCTKNKSRALGLAQILDQTNRERQQITESTFSHAITYQKIDSKVLFIGDKSYQEGVIGLVAGKLVEKFYRPAIVFSKGKIFSKASARSINGFNIIESLREFSDLFEDVGGHPMAAGFTIKTKHLSALQEKLEKLAQKTLDGEILTPKLQIDCQIKLSQISWSLFKALEKFAPFGLGNPQPTFISQKVGIVNLRPVGAEGKHLKLNLKQQFNNLTMKQCSNVSFDAIAFNKGHLASKLSLDSKIDICYTIEKDEWNNEARLQLKIKDIKIL